MEREQGPHHSNHGELFSELVLFLSQPKLEKNWLNGQDQLKIFIKALTCQSLKSSKIQMVYSSS